ncbi:hypothetical protein [Corynebacterium diphtheriae]|uniref:hypothetical protein n=1 Tax=Corynebacterium diphtheriae TaxID=1717 RepID=UPI000A4E06F7|nr:hypothetical protein [Corynebacterium diphtheriae]MBG9293948.1 hypothetical protein [Corynebacterium diphtheriae bv. mitis]
MTHAEWLHTVTGDSAVNAVATRSGIVPRTFARQVEKGSITAENVIAIAIAYNTHPVRALVDTGYLDEKYALEVDPATALKEVSEEDLADEVLRRMLKGLKTEALTTSINGITDLAKRRHTTPETPPHVQDYPYDAVADSSPDEEEGDDHDYYA